MGERRLVRLAVPQTSAGQIRAVRSVDHDRASPGAERAPAQRREIRHELVPRRADEVDELQLEHRPLSVRSETAGDAEDRRFSERRVVDLLRKFG